MTKVPATRITAWLFIDIGATFLERGVISHRLFVVIAPRDRTPRSLSGEAIHEGLNSNGQLIVLGGALVSIR